MKILKANKVYLKFYLIRLEINCNQGKFTEGIGIYYEFGA